MYECADSRFRDANRDHANNLRGRLAAGWVHLLDDRCLVASQRSKAFKARGVGGLKPAGRSCTAGLLDL